jgi:hypothetical protein
MVNSDVCEEIRARDVFVCGEMHPACSFDRLFREENDADVDVVVMENAN